MIIKLDYTREVTSAKHREPAVGWALEPPIQGDWVMGDRLYNRNVATGGPSGWCCSESGSPGLWTTLPETVS